MQTTRSSRSPLAAVAVLAAALAISLAAVLSHNLHVRRTLFFPRAVGRPPAQKVRFEGEERRVPARRSQEESIGVLVEEILLGPEDPEHRPLANPRTRLLSVVCGAGAAYIDLSSAFLDDGTLVSLEQQVQAIADTVYYNFPFVRRVFVLIDGREPDFSKATGEAAFDFRGGVRRSRLLEQ